MARGVSEAIGFILFMVIGFATFALGYIYLMEGLVSLDQLGAESILVNY